MHIVRIEHYPNNEIRATSFPSPGGRFSFEEETSTRLSTKVLPGPALTLPSISEPQAQSGFGGIPSPTRFGLKARRTLLRAGGALDKSGALPHEMVFLTGTLPGSTAAAKVAIAQWSGFIVDRLKSWLSKYCLDRSEFYVWEHQKRQALHLHWCVWIPDETQRQKVLERFKDQWCRLLDLVSEKSGTDLYARLGFGTWADKKEVVQAFAQECKKSVAAYMSKYCSKGANNNVIAQICPSRWWGISRPLRALLESLTTRKEYVCTNINSSKRKWEEICHTLEENCHNPHYYKSRCGLHSVGVGYHTPDDFASIRNHFNGDNNMKKGWLDAENETQYVSTWMDEPLAEILSEALMGGEFTEYRRRKIVHLIFEGTNAWDAETLAELYEHLLPWSFLDVMPTTDFYRASYPKFDARRFCSIVWRFCRDLASRYDQFYSPMKIDTYEKSQSFLSISVAGEINGEPVYVQGDLFGFSSSYEVHD